VQFAGDGGRSGAAPLAHLSPQTAKSLVQPYLDYTRSQRTRQRIQRMRRTRVRPAQRIRKAATSIFQRY